MLSKFLRIFFPEPCPVCKNPSTYHKTAPICPDCWQTITPYKGPICQKCGKPLVADSSITCSDCLKDAPSFNWARSFGLYEGVLKEAVNLMKYYSVKRLSKPLSEIMLGMKIPQADAIIPVPLHKKKLRSREFNQSSSFARHISKSNGIPVILNALVKIKETVPQVGLNARERKKNIKNSFGLTNRELIQGKDIILVDDVFTTGATVRECSRLLKKQGAGDIYVVLLAHSRGD
jgi:ComF family protein